VTVAAQQPVRHPPAPPRMLPGDLPQPAPQRGVVVGRK